MGHGDRHDEQLRAPRRTCANVVGDGLREVDSTCGGPRAQRPDRDAAIRSAMTLKLQRGK